MADPWVYMENKSLVVHAPKNTYVRDDEEQVVFDGDERAHVELRQTITTNKKVRSS